ncbi:hypothetical protein SprV_0100227200 [Sparganum proliferum]
MESDNMEFKVVVEGLPTVNKAHVYDYEAWMAPYGKVNGMYIYPKKLVIEFYQRVSATTAARYEDGAVFQGHTVSVSVMQPWHPNILGELIEWIGPEVFHGDLNPEGNLTNSGHSISASKDPVDFENYRTLSSEILLKKVMAESRFLTTSQLQAVFEIMQARRSRLGYNINASISTAKTDPWLTPDTRKLLKKVRALNKRRKCSPAAALKDCFREKLDRARIMVEECKTAWLEKIDNELQECDKSLFEVASQQGPSTS